MKQLFFAFFLTGSLVQAQGLYQFHVKGFPKTSPDCSKTATDLAEEFSRATGVTITEKKCRSVHYGYDIDLFYLSEKPLSLYSADNWSVYPSAKACQEHFAKEEALFQETTGLQPFLRFCAYDKDPKTSGDGIYRFTPVFWALGNPKSVVKTLSLHLFEGRYQGSQQEIADIRSKSQKKGLPLRDVYFDEQKHHSRLVMRFIFQAGQEPKDLSRAYLLKSPIENPYSGVSDFDLYGDPLLTATLPQCEEQKRRAQASFESLFNDPLVWFCMEDTLMYRYRLYHLVIKPTSASSLGKIIPGKDGEPFANEYVSNEACLQDLPRLMNYYKKELGQGIVGGLCSWPIESQEKSAAFLYFKE